VANPRPRPPAERGIALLIVLVVLFIVAVLMIDITLTATTARRSAKNASSDFLMDAAIEGRFQVAVAQLRYDLADNKVDGRNDRWAREEFTDVQPPATDDAGGDVAGEDAGVATVGDSDQVRITASIEDEERKFNLNLLLHPDQKQREAARERFAVLLDRFREDTPLDITRTQAEQLRDRVVDYLERAQPVEGEPGRVPVPKTNPWRLLTPDELRYVDGFEDTAHGLGAEGILYDAREPAAARAYAEDPANGEPPEVHKGLLRYVTLWSGTAWIGQPNPDSWVRVNVNTAEKPVLETLFYKNPQDFPLVERIIEWREQQKEESTADTSKNASPDATEPLAEYQVFEKVEDLKKVDGLDDQALERNGINGNTVTVTSDTFSLDFAAERDGANKQVRFIVRRHKDGVQTLLREERADPRFEDKQEEAAATDSTATAGK
jgi:type II secretory pathway component PulK